MTDTERAKKVQQELERQELDAGDLVNRLPRDLFTETAVIS